MKSEPSVIVIALFPDGTAAWRRKSDPRLLDSPMNREDAKRINFALHEDKLPNKDEG